jgi:lysine-specific demethylase/histidyl-hydroxylase NO66
MDDFLQHYWSKAPLVIKRGIPDYYDGLPDVGDVDELITATTSAANRSTDDGRLVRTEPNGTTSDRVFQLNRHGMPDIQAIYRGYRAGYSVVLNSLHHRSTTVAELCRAVEAELHHRVNANLYLTPRSSQGFHWHVDQHDVLIIQLHGTKQWHVNDRTAGPLDPATLDATAQQIDLSPGDLLYLPDRTPHKAVTAGTSSLHLTIGVHLNTWADLVTEILALVAERTPSPLGTALPPGYALLPSDAAELGTVARQLAEALHDDVLVKQATLNLSGRVFSAANAAVPGQFRAIDALDSLHEQTTLHHAPGVYCRVRITDDQARIEFANNYVAGPLTIEPALRFIAAHPHFAVADLPGHLSSIDRRDLVDRLVSEGLLTIGHEIRVEDMSHD